MKGTYIVKIGEKVGGFIQKESNTIQYISLAKTVENNIVYWYFKKQGERFTINENEDLLSVISRNFFINTIHTNGSIELIKHPMLPGEYHPRFFKPILTEGPEPRIFHKVGVEPLVKKYNEEIKQYKNNLPINEKDSFDAINQLMTLKEILNNIFKTVYPCEDNFKVYGHEIRNLLFLACTEAETQLKGILLANSIPALGNEYTTKDYHRLKNILKLDKYEIKFGFYPWIKPISPFHSWDSSKPTKSLPWYDCYNKVKHDREKEFARGDLEATIQSVSAVAVLLVAQYGENIRIWKENFGSFFEFSSKPDWKITERYLPHFENESWVEIPTKI